jgi:hypothetical protein
LGTVVAFAALYHWGTDAADWSNQDEHDGFLGKLYFSTTTLSTVGFGDVSPVTRRAKLMVMLEIVLVLLHVVE